MTSTTEDETEPLLDMIIKDNLPAQERTPKISLVMEECKESKDATNEEDVMLEDIEISKISAEELEQCYKKLPTMNVIPTDQLEFQLKGKYRKIALFMYCGITIGIMTGFRTKEAAKTWKDRTTISFCGNKN
jgi:hypothetical protein